MNSDITPAEPIRLKPSDDGRWISFLAPIAGSYELWRISTKDGEPERLTDGRHYISSFDQVSARTAVIRSTPTATADLWVRDGDDGAGRLHQVSRFNAAVLDELALIDPEERHVEVDGRDVQGWFIPGRRPRGSAKGATARHPGPVVTEIHGGPHTLYGWSPFLEFQILAGSGIGVFYSNPRGSEGYGREFNEANIRRTRPTSGRSHRSAMPTRFGRRCSSSTASGTSARPSARRRRSSPCSARRSGRSA